MSRPITSTLFILYGSQTGNAEDLAKRIGFKFKSKRLFPVVIQTMDDLPLKSLPKLNLALFICSTTGHGQEPENMKNFYNFIRRRDLPKDCLLNLKYAVYGLGDSSYAKFNFVSKVLYKRLRECGASPIQDLVIGDEQHRLGLDGVIYPKLEELEMLLESDQILGSGDLSNPESGLQSAYSTQVVSSNETGLSLEHRSSLIKDEFKLKTGLKIAKCILNKRLTPSTHFQDTRFLKFYSDEALSYEPGDVCTVLPENPDESVEQFINILNLDPLQVIALRKNDSNFMINYLYDFIPDGITLRDVVKCYLDIHSVPRRSFFEFLALFSDDQVEKEKLCEFATTDGQEEMYEYCVQPKRSILEVLLDFPHTVKNIKLDFLFDLIPPIKPRSFSIASASTTDPHHLGLIVGVVKYKTRLRKTRKGLCSNYLAQLKEDDTRNRVKFYLQRSMFKLPVDPSTPIIMIGPGLGIAPFRSFIQHRIAQGTSSSANSFLYFGCRLKDADFYFQDELENYVKESLISLRVAFSREDPKKYVQDLLLEDDELLRKSVLEKGATVYVAGNSKLPEDLRSVFARILQDHGERFVTELEHQNRILYDCW